MWRAITSTPAERAQPLPGDDIVPKADIVMDTAFSLAAPPATVWPWIIQLGKARAGWYFPRKAEWYILPSRRGLRHIEPKLQTLKVGDIIPDWGGKNETFQAAIITPPHSLVYRSKRGSIFVSWSINLQPVGDESTRMHFRLRMAPVKYAWLASTAGGFIDKRTIAWLADGLGERVNSTAGH